MRICKSLESTNEVICLECLILWSVGYANWIQSWKWKDTETSQTLTYWKLSWPKIVILKVCSNIDVWAFTIACWHTTLCGGMKLLFGKGVWGNVICPFYFGRGLNDDTMKLKSVLFPVSICFSIVQLWQVISTSEAERLGLKIGDQVSWFWCFMDRPVSCLAQILAVNGVSFSGLEHPQVSYLLWYYSTSQSIGVLMCFR